MKEEIIRKIIHLNHQFYQSFAEDFSQTRGRLQPGVLGLMDRFLALKTILDLGCGNGELAFELSQRGYSGAYHGADFSPNLLKKAGERVSGEDSFQFLELDLLQSSWEGLLPGAPYDGILCFAAMHHVPGEENRLNLVRKIRKHITDRGTFFLSNWQFLRSERFQERILPWSTVDIGEDEVDEGDYLLDWRRGGRGIRYVHHFSIEELSQLAGDGGFKIRETFYSDGKEGDLSLYQVWEPD